MHQRTRALMGAAIAVLTSAALLAPAHAEPGPGNGPGIGRSSGPGTGPGPGPGPGPGTGPAARKAALPPPHPDAGKPYPSQAEVDRARNEMKLRAERLDQIGEVLAAAGARAEEAYVVAEVAAERFNAARWELAEARKAAARAVRRAAAARVRVEVQRVGIASLVAQSYQDATALQGITTFMSGGAPSEIMQRDGVAQSAGASMKARYDEFAVVSEAAEKAEAAAERARKKARELSSAATTARSLASHATVAAQQATGRIGGTRGRLEARFAEAELKFRELDQDRRDALRRLRDRNPRNDPGRERRLPPAPKKETGPKIYHGIAEDTSMIIPKIYPGPVANPPEPDEQAAQRAIAFAKEQLGDMYLWAAVGPDRWDCSGLTMAAWQTGKISLPHYSEAQYLTSTPISAADLLPGDLIFWQGAQERIHHVAMYIGDGEMIHAEKTGAPVRIVAVADFMAPDYFGRPKR